MENLEKLLEYQKIDIELRKVLDEIERSDDGKKMEQARTEFNNAKVKVTETEKAAENIVAFYNNALAYYEECLKKIDEIAAKMAAAEDLGEQRELASQLEKLRSKLAEIEKNLAERADRTDKVIMSYLDGQDRGKKMRSLYNSLKERFAQLKNSKEPLINELRAKMAAIEKDIPATLMAQYKAITAEHLYPAFVRAREAERNRYRCFCGLELSQKAKSELLDKGSCRCETCRRLIYLDK